MTKKIANLQKTVHFFLAALIFLALGFGHAASVQAGTLSCSVATSCPTGTVVFKMYSTANTHAELFGQSNYSQLVCCTGVAGLGNTCAGTYAIVAKLSGVTNAHIEQGTQSNYTNNACLSVASGTVSVGYQSGNCTGYDTTLASMSNTTNAHIGDGNAFNTKICATASAGGGSMVADIVDAGGSPVASPAVSFSASMFNWGTQQSSGTLGTSTQKVRVSNSGVSNWTLSIAATTGPTALWQSVGNSYDFNGSAAVGRLQVNASGATITPQGGCATTGLSKGSATYFTQGTQDAVTLLSGSSAQTNCYWDLTGVGMTQDMPASQTVGNYSLSMTITAA